MFWKKTAAKSVRADKSSAADDEYDLAQFGIKTVSDKDIQGDLAKLMAEVQSTTGMEGINLDGSDDEEAAIMREIQSIAEPGSISMKYSLSMSSDASMDDDSDVDINDPHLEAELGRLLGNKPTVESERKRLQDLIELEKNKALELKRQGLVQDALAAMRQMKAYQAELANLPNPSEQGAAIANDDLHDDKIIASRQTPNNPQPNAAQTSGVPSMTPEQLQADIQSEKLRAIQLKRNGQVAEALAVLRNVKAMEASLAALPQNLHGSTVVVPQQASAAPPVEDTPQQPPLAPLVNIPSFEDIDDNKIDVTDDDLNDPSFDAELSQLHNPKPAEKTVPQTKPERRLSHDLIDEFEDDESNADSDEPPPSLTIQEQHIDKAPEKPKELPLEDQLNQAKLLAISLKKQGKIAEALEQLKHVKLLEAQLHANAGPTPEELQRLAAFEAIERELVTYTNNCLNKAKELISTNPSEARAQNEQRKHYADELQKLREARQNPLQPPPSMRIEKDTQMVEHINQDISEDLLFIAITEVRSTSKDAKDIFVKFSLNIPSQNPHQGSTPSGTGTSHIPLQAKFAFRIARSRGLQKLCELRKAQFEVLTTGGFWRSSESLGRGSLSLAPLVKTSEVDCWVPLMANRRPCGLDVHVIIRLRTPLAGPEMRPVTTTRLVVGPYPPLRTPTPQPPAQVAAPPPPPAPVLATQATNAPPDTSDPHDVENIVSYDVMNDEIDRITKRLESGPLPELSDRLDALQLKKQLLEIEMQTGKLTIEMYIERLQARIAADNALARAIYKQGLKSDAARVLHRVKLMQQEIDSARDKAPFICPLDASMIPLVQLSLELKFAHLHTMLQQHRSLPAIATVLNQVALLQAQSPIAALCQERVDSFFASSSIAKALIPAWHKALVTMQLKLRSGLSAQQLIACQRQRIHMDLHALRLQNNVWSRLLRIKPSTTYAMFCLSDQCTVELYKNLQHLSIDAAILSLVHSSKQQPKLRQQRVSFDGDEPRIIGMADEEVDRKPMHVSRVRQIEILVLRCSRVIPH